MYNDNLSEEIQDSLDVDVDNKSEKVRKYGKKEKKTTFKYSLFFILFLLITFISFIALDEYLTDKQMKKDSSKEENHIDKPKLNDKCEKVKNICDNFIEVLETIQNELMDINDESIETCVKLFDAITKLKPQVKEIKKNLDLESYIEYEIEMIKEICDIIECIIDAWETNNYEKCFNPPGSEMKMYLYNFINSEDLEILRPFDSRRKISDSNIDVSYICPISSIRHPIRHPINPIPDKRLYDPFGINDICRNPVVLPAPLGFNN